MTSSALQEKLVSSGATIAEYSGGETPAVFTDAETELTVLLSGCAIYDLGWRAKIVLTGEDRVRWLNGMVTNNVRDLAVGHGVYAFVLSPQGRIQADLYAYRRDDSLLIDTDRQQLEAMLKIFDHYIIMD